MRVSVPRGGDRPFNVLFLLFEQIGLVANITKTEVMVFLPGRTRTEISECAHLSKIDNLYRKPTK